MDKVYNIDKLLTYHGKQLDAKRVYVIKNRMKESKKEQPTEQQQQTVKKKRDTRSAQSSQSAQSKQHEQAQPLEQKVRLEDSFRDFKDLPPRKRKGRKETRDYAKLNSTVDIELWKRFEAERESRRWTATDMMELILFNTFGHPTLSYAEPEVLEPEPEEPKIKSKRGKKATGRAKK